MRLHDSFYLKENRYKKSKESFKFLIKILKKELPKNKIYNVLDIGCANGELIYALNKNFENFNITGIDIRKDLLTKARKNLPKKIILRKLNFNSKINYSRKFDIIICSGVISIFDNLKNFKNNIIKCMKKDTKLYLFGSFNEYNFDVQIKYKDLDSLQNNKILQSGWNIWSIKTIANLFKNKKIKKYKFNINKNIKKNKKDLIRSWTIKINKKQTFTNALLLIQNQMWLKVN